jgi:hypothetical protein
MLPVSQTLPAEVEFADADALAEAATKVFASAVTVPAGQPPPEPQGGIAGFAGEIQALTNWCWAAVTTSIRNHYQPALPRLRQCEVVRAGLGYPEDICTRRSNPARDCVALACPLDILATNKPGVPSSQLMRLGLLDWSLKRVTSGVPATYNGQPINVEGQRITGFADDGEFRHLLRHNRFVVLCCDKFDNNAEENNHYIIVHRFIEDTPGGQFVLWDPDEAVGEEWMSLARIEEKYGMVLRIVITYPPAA